MLIEEILNYSIKGVSNLFLYHLVFMIRLARRGAMIGHEKEDIKNSENQVGQQILISRSIKLFKIIKDFSHIMTYKDA
jgi:hypothetical protein